MAAVLGSGETADSVPEGEIYVAAGGGSDARYELTVNRGPLPPHLASAVCGALRHKGSPWDVDIAARVSAPGSGWKS